MSSDFRRLSQRAFDRRHEPAWLVLRQEVERSGAQRRDRSLLVRGSRDHDARKVGAARTDHVQRLQPAESRHEPIADREVPRATERVLELGFTGYALRLHGIAAPLQLAQQDRVVVIRILDDKESQRLRDFRRYHAGNVK